MLISPSAADASGRRELFNARDLIQNNPAFDILSFGERKMQVRFYANMRTIVGQEIFDIADLDGDRTLRSLLNILIKNFPDIQSYLF